jgi:hypothetical protein
MIGTDGETLAGDIKTYTTSGRGMNVDEISDLALRKLLHVADTTSPALAQQADLFKAQIKILLMRYMEMAIKSDRTTLYNQLKPGNPDVADIILRI